MKKWTDVIDNFIRAECPLPRFPNNSKENLLNLINAVFDTSFSLYALTTNCTVKRIFLGIRPKQCGSGKFRGKEPLPVGTERKKKNYWRVKVAQPNVWKLKKHYIWEQAHPEQPLQPYDNILSLDGNPDNFSVENLAYLPKRIIGVFQTCGGIVNGQPELTKLHLLQAQLKVAALDAGEKHGLVGHYGDSRVFKKDAAKREREKRKKITPEQREKERQRREKYYEAKKNDPDFKAMKRRASKKYSEKMKQKRG